ncbi:hypothetical protein OBBRIDRAFT_829917 [Obba rivulosa]|uniref:Uncharacterized protein n=1 Tax=Obba rivulosa TaxID=1052685 RepID=A0A8E2DVL8_9APHY|nr:hypothetical protein OBBRIDRAFT_829917 [Obba rivulosa]
MALPGPPPPHNPPIFTLYPSNGNANASQFIPRKEFIRDQRVVSTFSLLALSGPGFVRLYSFPKFVISALDRLLRQQNLITSVREHPDKNFYEFCLDKRPWASPKNPDSEKLIVGILAIVLQCGYSFLSTIDYGREPDDRLAIAFSKPVGLSTGVAQHLNGSTVTLTQPGVAPFAISFVSATVLRVIGPPLNSTPAILQAVRGAWPRGVGSEKKVGDVTYEFKYKGYKFFQADTFGTDSLHEILTLLKSLDSHGYTLLTSISLTKRSRVKDLWIFMGPAEVSPFLDSAAPSPANSSKELRRESASYPSMGTFAPLHDGSQLHARAASDTTPLTSSPLKPPGPQAIRAQDNVLRKNSPKTQVPDNSPTYSTALLPGAIQVVPSDSTISMDMTGVGSFHGRAGSKPRTPEVFYATSGAGLRYEYNPWQATLMMASQPFDAEGGEEQIVMTNSTPFPTTATVGSRQRGMSLENRTAGPTGPRAQPPRPRTASSPLSVPPAGERPPSREQQQAPEGGDTHSAGSEVKRASSSPERDSVKPRNPTPPLLGPGIFRDSAFSSITGWTADIPHLDEKKPALAGVQEEEGKRDEEQPPALGRLSAGPAFPGAWAATPREEKRLDDVGGKAPPSAGPATSGQEQKERRLLSNPTTKMPEERIANVRTLSPETIQTNGDAARKSEAAFVGTMPDRTHRTAQRAPAAPTPAPSTSPSPPSRPPAPTQSHSAASREKRKSPLGNDLDSGWVLVNIDGQGSAQGKGKEVNARVGSPPRGRGEVRHPNAESTTPPSMRTTPRTRSSSNTPTPRGQLPGGNFTGAAKSSMSPAAKAIVIMDAVAIKEQEKEKAAAGSGLRRIFGKSRERGKESGSGEDLDRKASRNTGLQKSERSVFKNSPPQRSSPAPSRPAHKRLSIL